MKTSHSFRHFLFILFMGIVLFGNLKLSAQECEATGHLEDAITGDPIPFASIICRTGAEYPEIYIGSSDTQGNFSLFIQNYSRSLIVNAIGYIDTLELPENFCGLFQSFKVQPNLNVLKEIMVSGFRNETSKEKVAASIGYIDRRLLNSTDQTSLQNAVNTVPGVIMESRGYGGSHRLNIRGSALRSPFAVRNVKMYLEGIPLTSPDGQAPLEMLDPADISSLEIIKGPAGSVWGSGNGGVLLFKAKKAVVGTTVVGSSFQAASYNAYRSNTWAEIGVKNGGLRISHVWQDNLGYRKQEFNHKNQFTISYNKNINEKNSLFLYGTFHDANWALPGALTAAQVKEDPRQAVKFSVDNNAYLSRQRLMGGLSQTHVFSSRFKETTGVYYYSTQKYNPYGTSTGNSGYKDEGSEGFGGRTDWSYSWLPNEEHNLGLKANLGGEWQAEKYTILENKIAGGFPSDFKYLYDIGYVSTMAFTSVDLLFKDVINLSLGSSINHTKQDVKGASANGFAYDTEATWKSKFLPRIALSARLATGLYLYNSISYGNANPTAFEMVDYENNNFNLSLIPEQGVNHEVGIKHACHKLNLQYEVNYYRFDLSNAILGFVSNSNDGILKYQNAGSTVQKGIEGTISKNFHLDAADFNLKAWLSGSYYHYVFDSYPSEIATISGNHLPGVPSANASVGLQLSLIQQIELSIIDNWFDKTPLDNKNNTWSNPYHLLNARISWTHEYFKHLQISVHAGANNLLQAKYSSFYALNAFGGRYYNPSPPLNFYAGLTLAWRFK